MLSPMNIVGMWRYASMALGRNIVNLASCIIVVVVFNFHNVFPDIYLVLDKAKG